MAAGAGGRSAAPAPHAARARQPRPGGHAGPVSSVRQVLGLGAWPSERLVAQLGARTGAGGACEGSREPLALGVSACAWLKKAAATSSRSPGPTLSEYQAAGELPGAFFCFLAFPLLQFKVGNPHRFLFRGGKRQGLGSQDSHKSSLPWGLSWAPSRPCRPNKGDPLKVSTLSSVCSPG